MFLSQGYPLRVEGNWRPQATGLQFLIRSDRTVLMRLVQRKVRLLMLDPLSRCTFPLGWNDSTKDVTVAILYECTTEEYHFSWETFLVADGWSWVQGGWDTMPIRRMVMQLSMHIEVSVSRLSVWRVTQDAVWSSVHISVVCQETEGGHLTHSVSIINFTLGCTWCGYKVPVIVLLRHLKGAMWLYPNKDTPVHVSTCTNYDFNVLTPIMWKLWRW